MKKKNQSTPQAQHF